MESQHVENITEAYNLLTSDPRFVSGYDSGRSHSVDVRVTTDDGSTYGPQGVYLGFSEVYTRDGTQTYSTSRMVINHANPESYGDAVPMYAMQRVDTEVLARFPEDRLARVANNLQTLLDFAGIARTEA